MSCTWVVQRRETVAPKEGLKPRHQRKLFVDVILSIGWRKYTESLNVSIHTCRKKETSVQRFPRLWAENISLCDRFLGPPYPSGASLPTRQLWRIPLIVVCNCDFVFFAATKSRCLVYMTVHCQTVITFVLSVNLTEQRRLKNFLTLSSLHRQKRACLTCEISAWADVI